MKPDVNSNGASGPRSTTGSARIVRVLAGLIRWWALGGGFITTGLAVMTAMSAISNLAFNKPFAADYELVKHFVAVVIFMFLPYCQLVGANVSVDIFTEGASARSKALMAILSSLLAMAFSLLLLRQMTYGLFSYLRYPEVTAVLKLPLWTAFPPILVSLLLLFVAASITALDGLRKIRGLPRLNPQQSQLPIE